MIQLGPLEKNSNDVMLASSCLSHILNYDFSTTLWIHGQKKVYIKPTKNEHYHRISILDDHKYSCTVTRTELREIQAIVRHLLPSTYGFDQIVVPSFQSLPEVMVTHSIQRKESGRSFGVTFSPPYVSSDMYLFARHGSYLFRFYCNGIFVGVGLSIHDISMICIHDFLHSGTLCFTSLSDENAKMYVERNSLELFYFFTAIRNEVRISYKLSTLEFLHLRDLMKDSIPILSGFEYAFGIT